MTTLVTRRLPIRAVSKRRILIEFSYQSAEHQFELMDLLFQRFVLPRSQKLQVAAQQQEIIQFARRSKGKMQELSQFDSACPAASFRNVGRNGIGSASHLTGQSISFLLGKSKRRPVNTQHHGMALLPDQQLSKILHKLTPFPRTPFFCTYHLILNTYNFPQGLFQ